MIFVSNLLSHLFISNSTTHTDLNGRSKMENSTINKKGVRDSSGKQFSFSNSHFFLLIISPLYKYNLREKPELLISCPIFILFF